jgi:hypothetical protein
MSGQSHPTVMIMAVMQRHEDFQAQAARERLGRLAQASSSHRRHWSDLPAVRAVATVLALLLTVSHRG